MDYNKVWVSRSSIKEKAKNIIIEDDFLFCVFPKPIFLLTQKREKNLSFLAHSSGMIEFYEYDL